MEKETGEENPFFYGAVYNYMNSNKAKSISNWIDGKGNVNITAVNAIVKVAKKQFEVVKENELEQRKRKQNYQNQSIEQQEEIIKQELANLDYNNLTINDLSYIAKNMEIFRDNVNIDDYEKATKSIASALNISSDITDWQIVAKYQSDNSHKKLNVEQNEILKSAPKELLNEDGKSFNQNKMKDFDILVSSTFSAINEQLNIGQPINQQLIMELVYNIMNLHQFEFSENLLNKVFGEVSRDLEGKSPDEQKKIMAQRIEKQNEINKTKELVEKSKNQDIQNNQEATVEKNSNLASEFSDGLAEFDSLEAQAIEPIGEEVVSQVGEEFELDFSDEFADALAEFDLPEEKNILTEQATTKSPVQQMQDAVEFAMDVQMSKVVDYAEMSREEPVTELESDKEDFVQEAQIIQEETSVEPEIAQDIEHEEPAQAELQDYEMEVEEKTGLAGLFSKVKDFIQNIPAIQGLFAKTSNQERLGDGKPQVTREDGIKQTSYFGNGSLEPWTVRARNFAIGIGTNIMEAISKVTKVSSKENNAIPINQPTIIKSQEKTDEEKQVENMELHPIKEQQMNLSKAVEQQGRKLDDNPWAVDVDKNMEKEALAKMAKAGKTSDIEKSSNYDKPNRDDDDGTIGLG